MPKEVRIDVSKLRDSGEPLDFASAFHPVFGPRPFAALFHDRLKGGFVKLMDQLRPKGDFTGLLETVLGDTFKPSTMAKFFNDLKIEQRITLRRN